MLKCADIIVFFRRRCRLLNWFTMIFHIMESISSKWQRDK